MKKLIPLFIVAAGAVAYTLLKNQKDEKEVEPEEIKYVKLDGDHTEDEEASEDKEETDEISSNIEEDKTHEDIKEDEDDRPSFFHETIVPAEVNEEVNASSDSIFNTTDAILEDKEIEEEQTETQKTEQEDLPELEHGYEPEIEHVEIPEITHEKVERIEHEEIPEIAYQRAQEIEYNETFNSQQVEDISLVQEEIKEIEDLPEPDVEYVPIDDDKHEEEVLEILEEPTTNHEKPQVDDIEETYRASIDPIIRGVLGDDAIEVEEEKPIYESEEVDDIIANIAQQVGEDSYQPETVKIVSPDEDDNTIYSDEVTGFSIQYPYLSKRFINDTLEFSEQFNAEYPSFSNVAIEHIVEFESGDDLVTFVQLIKTMNYKVSQGEEEHTVIVDKEMMVENESILNDVFVVANQAYCFNGEYVKFRITHI